MVAALAYFAYGTLQKGFQNWPDLADRLGDPVGRCRTVQPHALVVPIEPGCGNPGCGLLHRTAAMVPGVQRFHLEGDLFVIDRSTLAAIDRLERYEHRLASAEPKRCCVIEPGQSGPHDVIDPLATVR